MSWKRAGMAMLVMVPLIMLFTFGLRRGDPRLIPSPLVDRPAPAFTLPVMALEGPTEAGLEVTGDSIRIADQKGDIVVLNFFASWCVPCRVEHRALNRVYRRYQDQGVKFFGVVYNDDPPAIRRYFRQLGGQSYPVLLDPGQRVAIDYGLVGVPETFFIASDGTVARKIFSVVDDALLTEEIEALLARRDAANGETPGMKQEEVGE